MSTAGQMSSGTSNFSSSLAGNMEAAGVPVDEESLTVSDPDIKVVTATMTTVSVILFALVYMSVCLARTCLFRLRSKGSIHILCVALNCQNNVL